MEPATGRLLPDGWKEGPLLGSGGFARVVRCQDGKGRNLPLAAKVIDITSEKFREEARHEISILQRLCHEYIICYYDYEEIDSTTYIIMEFVPGGSISDLVKSGGPLPEARTRRYTRQIIEGLTYLHSQDIIHRDVKGANVLLDSVDNVKLIDFGKSKVLSAGGTVSERFVDQAGTVHYMSPEVLQEKGYGRKTDVWSLGCTIVEMLTGHAPWHKLKFVALMEKIRSTEPPEYRLPPECSDAARDILHNCFIRSTIIRPYVQELLHHEFCTDLKHRHKRCRIL